MEVSVPNLNVLPVCLPLPQKEKKTKCGQSRKRQSPFVVARLYLCTSKLYIPSTPNNEIILCAVKF